VHDVKMLVNINGLIEMKAHYGGGVLGVVGACGVDRHDLSKVWTFGCDEMRNARTRQDGADKISRMFSFNVTVRYVIYLV